MTQLLRFVTFAFLCTFAAASVAAAADGPMGRAGTPAPNHPPLTASSPVTLLNGVTDAIALKLTKVKITTIGQVAVAPLATVSAAAGPALAPQLIAQAKAIVEQRKGK